MLLGVIVETVTIWIVRAIAVVATSFALLTFAVPGGAVWMLLILIGIIYLAAAFVVNAFAGRNIDIATLSAFQSIVAFFPNGVVAIRNGFKSLWEFHPNASPSGETMSDAMKVATGIIALLMMLALISTAIYVLNPKLWKKIGNFIPPVTYDRRY